MTKKERICEFLKMGLREAKLDGHDRVSIRISDVTNLIACLQHFEEVVRCKDCRYALLSHDGLYNKQCLHPYNLFVKEEDHSIPSDFYCSDGLRK